MLVPLAPAAQDLRVSLRRPCRGQVCGGILGAMSRFAPPQLHEVMARIASPLFSAAAQRPTTKFCVFFALAHHQSPPPPPPEPIILRSAQQWFLLDSPCSAAAFEVNSEPHTGARPSVRLCVGLIRSRFRKFPYLREHPRRALAACGCESTDFHTSQGAYTLINLPLTKRQTIAVKVMTCPILLLINNVGLQEPPARAQEEYRSATKEPFVSWRSCLR
jgi:hypothetical protein